MDKLILKIQGILQGTEILLITVEMVVETILEIITITLIKIKTTKNIININSKNNKKISITIKIGTITITT